MILDRYENLSGQAINYAKSNFVFSPNTRTEDRMLVCDVLGVGEVCKPERYLVMPIFVGRNKEAIFGFLTDRIRQKLQGWENRELSKSGKLTLIKSAAQTIPNFWISLFFIPSSITNTMEKLMNGFYWGRGLHVKGIRWQAWDMLCIPKAGGGLGVKNLKKFNTTMLAKQGWRIMNNNNPLVSAMMRARYFLNLNFLNAKLEVNPSYVWRSLLSAHETLKEGCRVKIGRGEHLCLG
ncbi:putative mitochondrial protein AtMg00310 [Apium graveolens]|uniref:putative mitochondrial protein AtMg00310 n=1 Tax=Apium graveolens TaxID=4045 RepID=UPI003D7ACC75